jgi:hypothetical protein
MFGCDDDDSEITGPSGWEDNRREGISDERNVDGVLTLDVVMILTITPPKPTPCERVVPLI